MFKNFFAAILACLALGAQAEPAAVGAQAPAATAASVKLDLIGQMERDGALSPQQAMLAKEKYISAGDLRELSEAHAPAAQREPGLWERYATWTGFFYFLGVALLAVAFAGWIAKLAKLFMSVILAVPKEVYQGAFLCASAGMTLNGVVLPGLLSQSHAFWAAAFGAAANLILAGWILESHPRLAEGLKKLFNLGLPLGSVASFWLMLYFGSLALAYGSELFGFAAAVMFSGMMTFAVGYRPGVLWMDFEDKALPAVIFGNLAAVAGFAALKVTGHLPQEAALFEAGISYWCTIAMGVGFLVGASPYDWRRAGQGPWGWLGLLAAVALAGVFGYVFFDLKVIGSVLCVFAFLVAMEWYSKLCMKAGFVGGALMMGLALVGIASAMERWGSLVVLRFMS